MVIQFKTVPGPLVNFKFPFLFNEVGLGRTKFLCLVCPAGPASYDLSILSIQHDAVNLIADHFLRPKPYFLLFLRLKHTPKNIQGLFVANKIYFKRNFSRGLKTWVQSSDTKCNFALGCIRQNVGSLLSSLKLWFLMRVAI